MNITRVYTGADGETHFEDIRIPLRNEGPIGFLSDPIPAKAVRFRKNPPDYDYDWHVAPARQYIVLLNGIIEIEVSDGARRAFQGGDILLMEDTTGKGHRTRHLEKSTRSSIFIELD